MKLRLFLTQSSHPLDHLSVSVYSSQEVWSGLHESSSRVVSNPKEALERFLCLSEVADFVANEWPKRCAYWGWNQTKEFLRKRALYSTFVEACSVDLMQKNQLVKKTWRIYTDTTR